MTLFRIRIRNLNIFQNLSSSQVTSLLLQGKWRTGSLHLFAHATLHNFRVLFNHRVALYIYIFYICIYNIYIECYSVVKNLGIVSQPFLFALIRKPYVISLNLSRRQNGGLGGQKTLPQGPRGGKVFVIRERKQYVI